MHLFGICFLVYMMKISAPKGMKDTNPSDF